MYCRECGHSISDKAEICPSCGVRPTNSTNYCQSCGNTTKPNQEMCTSCGKTLKTVSKDKDQPSGLVNFASCCFPIVGLILYFVWKDEKPNSAKGVCKWAIIGAVISSLLYFGGMIIGVIADSMFYY